MRAVYDRLPVSPGHALVIPRRHVPNWSGATAEEQAALLGAFDAVRAEIERCFAPDGSNLAVNVGEAAGQTVPHLHLHVIPR